MLISPRKGDNHIVVCCGGCSPGGSRDFRAEVASRETAASSAQVAVQRQEVRCADFSCFGFA